MSKLGLGELKVLAQSYTHCLYNSKTHAQTNTQHCLSSNLSTQPIPNPPLCFFHPTPDPRLCSTTRGKCITTLLNAFKNIIFLRNLVLNDTGSKQNDNEFVRNQEKPRNSWYIILLKELSEILFWVSKNTAICASYETRALTHQKE